MSINSVAVFLDLLADLQLVETSQIEELVRGTQTPTADPRSLAQTLIDNAVLTNYQVEQLFGGRGRELVLGQYRLLEPLGERTNGGLFAARHQQTGNKVAVQIIDAKLLDDPDLLERFGSEVESAARLSHPNIAPVYEAQPDAEGHYLVLQYLEGATLKQKLETEGPLPMSAACEYIRQTALGLQHAFDQGFIHGNIRPENLLLVSEFDQHQSEVVKILGFGLACLRSLDVDGEQRSANTVGRSSWSAPDFIAPEQADDIEAGDVRSDLYSLGCTFYYLLAGHVPFPGGTDKEKVLRHQVETAETLTSVRPDVSSVVVQIVAKLMAKDPAERYQTPGEVVTVLASVTESSCPKEEEVSEPTLDPNVPTEVLPTFLQVKDDEAQPSCDASVVTQAAETIPPEQIGGDRSAELAGTPQITGYEIIAELGRGGMGVVYKAKHLKLNRFVALKVILAGGHAKQDDLVRFVSEAEAVAALQHPNIVQVFEIGQHEKLPYMALEFVAGGTLADRLKEGPLPPKEAAQILQQVACAMNAAHQAGIVHRDLKPANILIGDRESGIGNRAKAEDKESARLPIPDPRSPIIPKITDFGVAKRIEAGVSLTQTGAVMGTPSYMAPEQASGEGKRVGPAADVYALGAILYECLTGRPPFQGDSVMDTLYQVVNNDPTPPRQLEPKVPRDLDTICLKCVEKSPAKRYASAQELADELGRFLVGQPIRARPITFPARLTRWCCTNPLATTVIVLVLAFAIGGPIVAIQQASLRQKAEESQQRAQEQAERHRRLLYVSDISVALQAWDTGNVERVVALLDRHRPSEGQIDLRGFEWYYLWQLCQRSLNTATIRLDSLPYALAYSPDGKTVASAGRDNVITLWDAHTQERSATLGDSLGDIYCLAYSRQGSLLASGGQDTTVKVWDTATGNLRCTLPGHGGGIRSVAFAPDAKTLAAATYQGKVRVWDMKTGQLSQTLEGHGGFVVGAVAFSPDGKTIASGAFDHKVKLWNWRTKSLLKTLKGHAGGILSLAFSSDGKSLASGSADQTVRLWDVSTGEARKILRGHKGDVFSVAFAQDRKTLASAGSDNTVWLWNVITGKQQDILKGHSNSVFGLSFSPDGATLASASSDRTIKLWNLDSQAPESLLTGWENVHSVAFSTDGALLVSASADGMMRLWDVATGEEHSHLQGFSARCVQFSPKGNQLAAAGEDFTIKLLDLPLGTGHKVVGKHGQRVIGLAFSPDGTLLASAGDDKTVRLWNVQTGKELRMLPTADFVNSVTFSRKGNLLAWGDFDRQVVVWNWKTQKQHKLKGHDAPIPSVQFSPDGQTLASCSWDATIKLWDLATMKPRATLKGHGGFIYDIAFSPDGATLASGGSDRTVKLWDVSTGQERATLRGHTASIYSVAFSPDGNTLASGSLDKTVRLWRAAGKDDARQK